MEKPLLTEVKVILKSLVMSCPEKITIEQLNRDYRDVEGQFIPFRKLGYENIEKFLHSIPDTLRVVGSGLTAMVCFVANEKSEHIHNMIMRQKKPKAKGRPPSAKIERSFHLPPRGNRYSNKIEGNTKKPGQQLSPFQSVNRSHLTKTPQVKEVPNFQQIHDFIPLHLALPQPSGITWIPNHMRTPPPPLPWHQTKSVGVSAKNNADSHIKTKYKSPKPEFKEANREYFENSHLINKKCLNEAKVAEPTKQLPIEISQNVETLLNMPKLLKPINPIVESNTNKTSKELQNDIMYPLAKKDNFTKINLPEIFFDDSSDRADDPDEAVPSFAAKNNVFRVDFPKYCVPYGKKILQYKLDNDITFGSCIRIFVSEIHNPFKFWFHIHKEKDDLDKLMNQIERFYSELEAEDLRIPLACLIPGQVCAASYNGLWHRAEIDASPVNKCVKVSFIDYGTVTEIEIENIKFLASYFAKLPAQVLRGCLSHIKPNGFHWSHECTRYFLKLVEDKLLYAKISEVDREQNILYMVLCDSNGDEVVQINKSLIIQRYALFNEEWTTEKIERNYGKRLHHPREDFPTFAMIESGEYPTFIELVDLLERGIEYETIYDLIIYNQTTILNKHDNVPECIRNLPYFLTTTNPFRSDILWELNDPTTKVI